MTTSLGPAGSIGWALDRLLRAFRERYGASAQIAATDPRSALDLMEDVVVIEDSRPRVRLCQVDATYEAEPPTIRWRPTNTRRDNFTLLHEVAHHLLAHDEEWCFDIAPAMGATQSRFVEEEFANAFAANILISGEAAAAAFRSGVTSQGCVELYRGSSASASACLARALTEPGDRLVILSDIDGHVWFAASTGEPFNPGRNTIQPAIAAGATQALAGSGSYRFSGGDGLHYRSGKTFTAVAFDITVEGALVFAVVSPTLRTRHDFGTHELSCPECDETLDYSLVCDKCREPRCHRCRACACPAQRVLCATCFIELPKAVAASGTTHCENCD